MIDVYAKINIPITRVFSLLPYGDGVYFTKLTRDYLGYGPYYSQWESSTINSRRFTVGAVSCGASFLSNKSSLSDCQNERMSFYWDNSEQVLYVNPMFGETDESGITYIGQLSGFCNSGTDEGTYINDIYYDPRLTTVPEIKKEVDRFEVGKMKFASQSFTLTNGDGALDYLLSDPVPGAEGAIVLYDTETGDELQIYTGFVSADASDEESITITLKDRRKRENNKIPTGTFTAIDYPHLESRYENKVIPEGYGSVLRIKGYPVNGDETSPTYITFKYASDATTLTKVEIKEDDVWADVTASVVNDSPSTGSFDLPYATATNSAGAVLECVVSATLRSETNPGDIIADMNNRYNSINYDSSNYDTSEWATEAAKLADVYLYMDKKKEFFKYIELLQNSSNLWFVYDILGDGTRALRVNDPNRSTSRTVDYYDSKGDIDVERDFTEYSSTVTVTYAEDLEAEVSQEIYVDTYKDYVIEKYRFENDSEFESTLIAEADAQEKADVIAEDQSESRRVVTVPLHGENLSDITDKLYDVISVNTSRPDDTYWQGLDTITATSTATDTITATSTANHTITATTNGTVVAVPGREYHGTIRAQILGIEYNPESLDYILTARERPESEVL